MEAIFKRRSVRKFTSQMVDGELIRKILSAGMAAPSAGNEQPWQFIVVKNKETLKKVSDCSPHAKSAAAAMAAIIVCGDLSLEKHAGYWVQDCSAAVENMLIETAFLGLGAAWLGVYPLAERVTYLQNYFSLPKTIVPFAVVPVGFPAQELPANDRYNQERVHYEKW